MAIKPTELTGPAATMEATALIALWRSSTLPLELAVEFLDQEGRLDHNGLYHQPDDLLRDIQGRKLVITEVRPLADGKLTAVR